MKPHKVLPLALAEAQVSVAPEDIASGRVPGSKLMVLCATETFWVFHWQLS